MSEERVFEIRACRRASGLKKAQPESSVLSEALALLPRVSVSQRRCYLILHLVRRRSALRRRRRNQTPGSNTARGKIVWPETDLAETPFLQTFVRDGNTSGVNGNNVDWDTEDELDEIDNFTLSSSANLCSGEGSSSPGPSNTKVFGHFVSMGFSHKMVSKAVKEHGEEDADSILESLLLYNALENSTSEQDSPPEQCFRPQQQQIDSDPFCSDYEGSFLDGFSDLDSSDSEENFIPTSEEDKKLVSLVNMGYTEFEASIAIERCGVDSSLVDLTDFISAAQFSKAEDVHFPLEEKPRRLHIDDKKKRKLCEYAMSKRKKKVGLGNGIIEEDDEALHLPNPMIGFGTPTHLCQVHRNIPEAARGPPYFYYENVALTPKGVWNTISRFLYDIPPEFVDSKYFCAAARKRGYVHNLPIENRFPLIPLPPQNIFDAFPMTRRWWPSWDERRQLNCLQTCYASAQLTERIRLALKDYGEDEAPPERVRRYVLHECRKWNLLWVGKNKVAPLEPDEVEMLLGFPRNHTRGISRTDRYKSLGNSFQIDTVAYHLCVERSVSQWHQSPLSFLRDWRC
ncbi:hypothetical protein ACLB2K_057892 [Fragaria x ananassa]